MATSDNGGTTASGGKPQEKKARRAHIPEGVEQQAERLARSLGESAQHIWLAGIGALGRAQSEGSKLFASLVEEGEQLERQARKSATDRAAEAVDAVGQGVDEVRGFAEGTWDRWEKGFDERMQRALARLGVPSRQDIQALERQVQALRTELRRERAANAERETAAKTAAGSVARKGPAKKSATGKPAAGSGAGDQPGTSSTGGAAPAPGPDSADD